ncbi:hypothetical protein ATI61_107291 [Archangium gephyra]|uniref:Uncharacterized protein n=1 Tax=Archangium gephyra TaxID=48 RepID=A0AAC8TJF3_9BACT|nr:hypothetical protein [Archangium gephyra]AKJ07845.1 Hypothetical protein AA314_09471 [Archangium gephyra]REG29595.1 hypothetical protein ATI61_107291 [Archangium gephyra]
MDISDLFSGEFIAFFVIMAVAVPWVFWSAKKQALLDEKRQASWANMAGPLGLTYEKGGTLSGEFEGLPVRIFREKGERMGGRKENDSVYVVRVEVPGKLPRHFVAAPRKWTSLFEGVGTPNVFKAGEPVLDKAHIFQCGPLEEGRKLLQEPDVQQALRELVNPESVSFVQDNHVGLAYEKPTFMEDAGKVRHNLESLVRAAHALAKAQERLRLAA